MTTHPDETEPTPVPVHGVVTVQEDVTVIGRASDFGAWTTTSVPGTAFNQPLLPYDEARSRALIIVSGTGPVYLGTKAQCQASPPVGGLVPAVTTFEYKSKRELWLAGDGSHTATVTVLLERFES